MHGGFGVTAPHHARCFCCCLVLYSQIDSSATLVVVPAWPLRCDLYIRPPMSRLGARLERLGTLKDVILVSTDTCCAGAKDVTVHFLRGIFPSLTRAPHGDNYHKTHILTESTVPCHPLRESLSRLVNVASVFVCKDCCSKYVRQVVSVVALCSSRHHSSLPPGSCPPRL